MTVTDSTTRTIDVLRFWLRVLFLATIASPIIAGENENTLAAIESPSPEFRQSDHGPLTVPLPVEDVDEEVSLEAEEFSNDSYIGSSSETLPSTTYCPDGYWIVSSRRSVQTIHHKNRPAWGLDAYYCPGNGQIVGSNLASLKAQLVPGIPVCVFSHGSFVTFESQAQQAARAAAYFRSAANGQPLQLIFFTWPSDGPYSYIAPVDVTVRGKRAEFNGFHMATLISSIPESCPVTVIGHSHGSRVALAAMQLASGGPVQDHYYTGSIGNSRRLRVILAAGAMDHNWLNPGERYGVALNRVECLLNLRNQNDLALAWYPLSRPFAKRAIARSGITSRDMRTLGYNAQKIRQVDITNRLGSNHQWPEYYSDPVVLGTILPYLVSF
ncbi:alpha/beta hydrolase [Thalassoglobus sp. JC818]|uniref:alpha/beta hydrolase n=1 Tax=Thalassoglobus sp. JC818 TaxID=3232136 RepID=UPI003458CB4C